jgi:hypothetical protein
VLSELLAAEPWRERLPAVVMEALLEEGPAEPSGVALPMPPKATLDQLERLTHDPLPTVAAAALALSTALDPGRERGLARSLLQSEQPAWVRQGELLLATLPELEKRVVLATSDFFRRTWADTLDALAERAEIRCYGAGELITEAGDTCRELLLLIEGAAQVKHPGREGEEVERMRPGQVLDELEVLTHSTSESTIVAEVAGTRVLAVPVDSFDATLERDPDFARRVLAMETRQLQRLTRGEAEPSQ